MTGISQSLDLHALGYQLNDRRQIPVKNFSARHHVHINLRPTKSSILLVPRALYDVKRPGHKADNSSLPNVE